MKERGAVMTFEFPRALIARAKKVNVLFHTKTTQLIREGLAIRVEQLEEKHRRETALQEADEAAKREKEEYRKRMRAAGSTLSPLTPLSTQVRTSGVVSGPTQDPMEALYTKLARAVLDAKNKEEQRERVAEAIAAVQRERPLTAPPEDKILATLETYVVKLREEKVETVRTVDDFVGAVLDVSKLKTSGAAE